MATKKGKRITDLPYEQTINFHDSQIVGVAVSKKNLSIVVKIDTHWFPGAQYGVFEFKEVHDENFTKTWQDEEEASIKFLIIKDFGDYIHLVVKYHTERYGDFTAKSYSFKRVKQIKK